MGVNRIGYLADDLSDVTPLFTRDRVELWIRHADGQTIIARLTHAQAEALYDKLRWGVEGIHTGKTPAS